MYSEVHMWEVGHLGRNAKPGLGTTPQGTYEVFELNDGMLYKCFVHIARSYIQKSKAS